MEQYFLYRSDTLFALLSYNGYENKRGVCQKPLKDWVTTVAPETSNYLFSRLTKPVRDVPSLFKKNDFDYEDFFKTLDEEYPSEPDAALLWMRQGHSFLLTDDIVSNPDACFWNWCSAAELEWAVKERYKEDNLALKKDDDYLRLAKIMRQSEADGFEVRMIYCYDFTTRWLGEEDSDNNSNDDTAEQSAPQQNYLLMYLLQNRADDFIKRLRNDGNNCYMGILMLYRVAYANKLLLTNDDWLPHCLPEAEKCKAENAKIIEYLESLIKIPENFADDFEKFLKPYAWLYDDEEFKFMLEGSLELLIQKGYREIDCLAYEAGMKFNFERLKELLNQGADPYVHISGDYIAEEAAKLGLNDANVLYDDASDHICDIASHYSICDCWKEGMEGKETTIDNSLIRDLFRSAGCQLVVNIIRDYAPQQR
jgi:hypothetical protein